MTAPVNMAGLAVAGAVCVAATATRGHFLWRCDCGQEFERRGAAVRLALKRNGRTSCGCAGIRARAENGRANRTHGLSVGPTRRLYDVWRQMLRRCSDPACRDFPAYGGRGITVCQEWQQVETFCAWALVTGYRPGLTIDRVDVDGPYKPGNCRWATPVIQGNNVRKNRTLSIAGRTLTVSQWSRESGLHVQTILRRINAGWSPERCVAPVQEARP